MKTIKSILRSYCVGFVLTIAFCFNGFSQIIIDPGTPSLRIGIVAVDSLASETGGDKGVFKIYRVGDLTHSLTVSYTISGTASNRVDYREIPKSVTIPEGKDSVFIEVVPIDDEIVEPTETVVLTLNSATSYAFDVDSAGITANRAIVQIFDNDGNKPPKVTIAEPKDGAIFQLPTQITIRAEAKDEDGIVQRVGFFANGTLLGYVFNQNSGTNQNVFTFTWFNPTAGEVKIKARAIDNVGAETDSAEVSISVREQVPERDVVSVYVIDGEAEEIPPVPPGMGMPQRINFGTIRFWRKGPTNFPLYVNYSVGGTAQNGGDYERLTGLITIPEGIRYADLDIIPIYDEIKEETETVVVTVEPPACIAIYPPPPDCYIVGEPKEAVVKILDSQTTTNTPPAVAITNPKDSSVFTAPADIVLTAEATDLDGFVKIVEFWANDAKLVTITNYPESMRPVFPYYFIWRNVKEGEYTLIAKATDNRGAQTSSAPVKIAVKSPSETLPVVTIVANDPEASELPPLVDAFNYGVFTVRRTGPLDSPLTVYYRISGTAQNGGDYEQLNGVVTIPAGMAFADIVVKPIDDNLAEGTETVVASLILPEIIITIYPPPPPPYRIGEPNCATVYIRDNEPELENKPPIVKLVKPDEGITLIAPANIGICAEAHDPDGRIAKIEFFEGERKLGEVVPPLANSTANRYYYVWQNVGAGSYTLTAVATDNRGATTRSAPVSVKVVEAPVETIPVVNIEVKDGFAAETPTTPIVVYTNFSTAAAGAFEVKTERIPAVNTATFVIVRNGPTNEELAVHYIIRGTASNGVDYLKLPGVAVIPEGTRRVEVTVIPIDDTIPEPRETVVLTLTSPPTATADDSQQSSNTSVKPPYIIGPRARACVVIADNDTPMPPVKLPDGNFHILQSASNGVVYMIEASADLTNWTSIYTNTVTEGFINYADPDSVDYGFRFYRIRTIPTLDN
ncbi:MAG: Ig-like domain-containing protein [Verrucomicrobiae bacterium]|nr:Ig-like domain-containing protein [Verrucomicrobiae bacterium]